MMLLICISYSAVCCTPSCLLFFEPKDYYLYRYDLCTTPTLRTACSGQLCCLRSNMYMLLSVVFLHQMINRFKYHHYHHHHQYRSESLPLDPCRLRGSVGGVHLSSIPAGPSRRTAEAACRTFKTNEILMVLKNQ